MGGEVVKARVWKEGGLWLAVAPGSPELFSSSHWQAAFNFARANLQSPVVISNEPLPTPVHNVDIVHRGRIRRWLYGY